MSPAPIAEDNRNFIGSLQNVTGSENVALSGIDDDT
jgi:hypothetical protein